MAKKFIRGSVLFTEELDTQIRKYRSDYMLRYNINMSYNQAVESLIHMGLASKIEPHPPEPAHRRSAQSVMVVDDAP